MSKSLPIRDEKILGQLRTFQRSLQEIEKIYGAISKSPDEPFQQINDTGRINAIAVVNEQVYLGTSTNPEHATLYVGSVKEFKP